jgi:hypothetical protein
LYVVGCWSQPVSDAIRNSGMTSSGVNSTPDIAISVQLRSSNTTNDGDRIGSGWRATRRVNPVTSASPAVTPNSQR